MKINDFIGPLIFLMLGCAVVIGGFTAGRLVALMLVR